MNDRTDLIAEAEEHRPRMRFFVQECSADRHPWPCLVRRLADALADATGARGFVQPLPIVPIEPDVMVDER